MNERERREEDARGNAEHLASVKGQSASGRMTAGEAEDGFIGGRQLHALAELGTSDGAARTPPRPSAVPARYAASTMVPASR